MAMPVLRKGKIMEQMKRMSIYGMQNIHRPIGNAFSRFPHKCSILICDPA
jgi:uncharacterized protein (DUF924 family)